MGVEHRDSALGKRHPIHNWEYPDDATRTAATGFLAADVGKVALQLTGASGGLEYWTLSNHNPITWVRSIGVTGPTGPTGPAGPAGTPGSVWREGTGAPANTLGVDGDFFLDDANGDVYQKAAGVYAVVANIRGPAGPSGTAGAMDDLSDVTITAVADGHYIKRRGTVYVNEPDYIALPFIIDGGGAAITTGIKGDIEVPAACVIERATLLADQAGSIVIDIWRDIYANFPPLDADSITGTTPPTLATAASSQDTTLTGWATTLAAGDILRFNVDSAATLTRVTLSLRCRKT